MDDDMEKLLPLEELLKLSDWSEVAIRQAQENQRYLTIAEVRAKLGGRSRSAIYADIEKGRLPKPIKLGGRVYWPEAQLVQHLCKLSEKAA